LEQGDGQELGQELNLDPKRIAPGQESELEMGFPSFEEHFDLPPTTVGFQELLGAHLLRGDIGQQNGPIQEFEVEGQQEGLKEGCAAPRFFVGTQVASSWPILFSEASGKYSIALILAKRGTDQGF